MNALHIVPVGSGIALETLDGLAADLAGRLRVSCHVRVSTLEPAFAWGQRRNQYWSTAILKRLLEETPDDVRVLGVTELDLYVPVLTFVFGEAQVGGRGALVSLHRLRNEFYGLPPEPELLRERLIKEALHEIGHTCGLRHCSDWRCVMTSSHGVEKLDTKADEFCESCRGAVGVLNTDWTRRTASR